MQLATLLGPDPSGPEIVAPAGCGALTVTGLTADSRAVQPGFVFVAVPGTKADGAGFVPDAVARGAVAVVVAREAILAADPGVPVLRAAEPRRALALMAARLYPRQPAVTVAVTGTSGKSSVAEFTRQIFAHLGHQAASVGTIGVVKPDGAVYGALTTPDPVTLHRTLDALAGEGITHLAFEASSHGLDQHRLDGVRLTAAAFTNLSRDHLDYHPTMEAYLAAKLRLFTEVLPQDGTAVVFIDDGYFLDLHREQVADGAQPDEPEPFISVLEAAQARGLKVMTVGLTKGIGDLWGCTDYGQSAAIVPRTALVGCGDVHETIAFPLIGNYQLSNALVAAGLAIAAGVPARDAIRALAGLKGVAGRLELVGHANGAPVLVDYAHKPEALDVVLGELKPAATGRLICVFGCGGDRDRGKRPIMGEIAVRRADVVIVTDDNPRSEDPAAIRAAILAAAPGAIEIGDRRAAIRHAIGLARAGDVVVIAGKGHETGQIVGGTVLPFCDQDEARAAIAELTP